MIPYANGSRYPGNKESFPDGKSGVCSGLLDWNLKVSSRLISSRLAVSSSAAAPGVADGASYRGSRWCLVVTGERVEEGRMDGEG